MYGYIYKIENIVNGKLYIGQSTDVNKRKLTHFNDLKNNKHGNQHLQRAFNKYGKSNFKHLIIVWADSKKELDKLEIYFIKKYDSLNRASGYNIRDGGSHGKLSQESKVNYLKKVKIKLVKQILATFILLKLVKR